MNSGKHKRKKLPDGKKPSRTVHHEIIIFMSKYEYFYLYHKTEIRTLYDKNKNVKNVKKICIQVALLQNTNYEI